MSTPDSTVNRFEQLHHSIRDTARIRFHSAHRLSRHARLSQWTIAILSVALILISLISGLGLPTDFSPAQQTVIQVGLAVLVLVFSLLIGSENYSVRADKAHRCGLELNHLARKLESYRGKDGLDDEYERFSDRYFEALNQYENHEDIDYLTFTLSERHKNYPKLWRDYAPALVWIYSRYWAGFVPYFLLFFVVGAAFWKFITRR